MADALGLLGLARRGGRLALGNEAVQAELRAGRVQLLLLASDAGTNAVRHAERWAEETHVELLIMPYTKSVFGRAVGRRECALAALTDQGFVQAYKKIVNYC